jgi:hypothetical protein
MLVSLKGKSAREPGRRFGHPVRGRPVSRAVVRAPLAKHHPDRVNRSRPSVHTVPSRKLTAKHLPVVPKSDTTTSETCTHARWIALRRAHGVASGPVDDPRTRVAWATYSSSL